MKMGTKKKVKKETIKNLRHENRRWNRLDITGLLYPKKFAKKNP